MVSPMARSGGVSYGVWHFVRRMEMPWVRSPTLNERGGVSSSLTFPTACQQAQCLCNLKKVGKTCVCVLDIVVRGRDQNRKRRVGSGKRDLELNNPKPLVIEERDP